METVVSDTSFINKGVTYEVKPLGKSFREGYGFVECTHLFCKGKQIPGIYIVKQLSLELSKQFPETAIDQMQKKYDFLEDLGCPVIPMVFDVVHRRVFIQDPSVYERCIYLHTRVIEQCKGIDCDQILKLYEQMIKIALLAYDNGNGVFLNSCAYTIVVSKFPRILSVILINIGQGSFFIPDHAEIMMQGDSVMRKAVIEQAEIAFRKCFPSIEIPPMVESAISSKQIYYEK